MKETIDIPALVDELQALHAKSCENLRSALAAYINEGIKPDPIARAAGAFCYPEIRVVYAPETASWPSVNRAFARMNGPGAYAVSITRPAVFRDYLIEQLSLLSQDYGVDIEVGLSSQEMPYPYVLDGSGDLPIDQAGAAELSRWFPTSSLADIGDEVPDGVYVPGLDKAMPLALFDAPRVDFSLKRLQHYTGAPAEHTQSFILFTNYHRYVDEFVRWAAGELRRPGTPYTGLSCSGNVLVDASTANPEETVANGAWRRHQMPAYHLMAPGGQGITLVNIGVGPSNAKTICDHLAVLRPQAWLMIGHCGGLRGSQKLGDYVLAHAYLRDDHVLDHVLPIEIPIAPIAEVQQAMQKAAEIVTGETREQLKGRLRTGTIVTTDDRNWELRYSLSAVRFNQSRAVGIDMESATIAAQGYRFRVPYGTLLCVSDKPLHGEIKLPGQANRFYEQAIGQHLKIGIERATLDVSSLWTLGSSPRETGWGMCSQPQGATPSDFTPLRNRQILNGLNVEGVMAIITAVSFVPKSKRTRLRHVLSTGDTGELRWREKKKWFGSEFHFTGPTALVMQTHRYITHWLATEGSKLS